MTASSVPTFAQGDPSFTVLLSQELEKRLGKDQFETWFHDFELVSLDDHAAEFSVPNGFVREWITRNFLATIQDSVRAVGQAQRHVKIRLLPRKPCASDSDQATPLGPVIENLIDQVGPLEAAATPHEKCSTVQPSLADQGPFVHGQFPNDGSKSGTAGWSLSSPLNQNYTFEQFVVGPCNRLAHAAALAIGTNPGRAYNPFFVHGSVGLGKSHVLQAICHAILRSRPGCGVLYLSCEEFTNRFIRSIQNGAIDEFRSFLRRIDVLVIDDVEFLANKERTQEEFFHTFNTLYHSHKQIVLSSDRPPHELPSLQKRLVSRFKWGLETDVQPPCFETRVAIVKRKARMRSHELDDKVAHYIAEHIDSNIRELEGAVIKVVGIATLMDREITTDLAQEALQGVSVGKNNHVSLSNIMSMVTTEFSLSAKDLTGKSRTQAISLPRQIGMFLARENTEHSLEEVGRFFGNRDHTTVLYAVGKIRKRAAKDRMFQDLLTGLGHRLRAGEPCRLP